MVKLSGSPARGRSFAAEMCGDRGNDWRQLTNDARAHYLWGLCLLTGFNESGRPTPDIAHEHFLAAARLDLPEAKTQVGVDFEVGIGVAVDYAVSRDWYLRAARQGSALALNRLGLVYDQGLGVPRDEVVAYGYFSRAAELGLAMAQTNVADRLANGTGTAMDVAAACRWYAKAAAQGDEVGLSRLKDCRRSGYER